MEDEKCTSHQNHDAVAEVAIEYLKGGSDNDLKNTVMENLEQGSDKDVKEVAVENAGQESTIGDIVWVKLRKSLWWPAVVVGGKSDKSYKVGDKISGTVRVRTYGSYTYMHVDPSKWHSEFQSVIKQHNGSYRELFSKSLEQHKSGSKSGRSKRKASESKDTEESNPRGAKRTDSPSTPKNSNSKTSKQDSAQKKAKLNSPSFVGVTPGKSQESSARRTKVMQSLGLIAPFGSPFHKIKNI